MCSTLENFLQKHEKGGVTFKAFITMRVGEIQYCIKRLRGGGGRTVVREKKQRKSCYINYEKISWYIYLYSIKAMKQVHRVILRLWL